MSLDWDKSCIDFITWDNELSDFTDQTLKDIIPEINAKVVAITNLFWKLTTNDPYNTISITDFLDIGVYSVREENLADIVNFCQQTVFSNPANSELRRLKNQLINLHLNENSSNRDKNKWAWLIIEITCAIQEIINRVCDMRSFSIWKDFDNIFIQEWIEEKILESQEQRWLAVDILQLRKAYIDAQMFKYMEMSCDDLLETQVRVAQYWNIDVRYKSIREILANHNNENRNSQMEFRALTRFIAKYVNWDNTSYVLSCMKQYQKTSSLIMQYQKLQAMPTILNDSGIVTVNNDLDIRSWIEKLVYPVWNNLIEDLLEDYTKWIKLLPIQVNEIYTRLLKIEDDNQRVMSSKTKFVDNLIWSLTDEVMFDVNFDWITFEFSDAYIEDLPFILEVDNSVQQINYTCRYVRIMGWRSYLELSNHALGTWLYFYDAVSKLRWKKGWTNLQNNMWLPTYLCGEKDQVDMYNTFNEAIAWWYIQVIRFTDPDITSFDFEQNSYNSWSWTEVLNSELTEIDELNQYNTPLLSPEDFEKKEQADHIVKLTASEYILDVIRALKGGFKLSKDQNEGLKFAEFDTWAAPLWLNDLYTYLDTFPELMTEHVLQTVIDKFMLDWWVTEYITSNKQEYKRNLHLMLIEVTEKAKSLIQLTKVESEKNIPNIAMRLKLASVLEEHKANIKINGQRPWSNNKQVIDDQYASCIEELLWIQYGRSLTITNFEIIPESLTIQAFLSLLERKTSLSDLSFGGDAIKFNDFNNSGRAQSSSIPVNNSSLQAIFRNIITSESQQFEENKPALEEIQTYYLMDKSADMLFHGFLEACAPSVVGLPSTYATWESENILHQIQRTESMRDTNPWLKVLTNAIGTWDGEIDIYTTDMIAGVARTIVTEAAMLYVSWWILNLTSKGIAASRYVRLAKTAFHRATKSTSVGWVYRLWWKAWNAIWPWWQTATNYALNTVTHWAWFHAIHALLQQEAWLINQDEFSQQLTSLEGYIHSMIIMWLLGIWPTIAGTWNQIAYWRSYNQALQQLSSNARSTNITITSWSFWNTLQRTGVQFPLEVAGMYGIENYIFPRSYLQELEQMYPHAQDNITEQMAVIQQLVWPLLLVSILKWIHNLPMGKPVRFQEINITTSRQGANAQTFFSIEGKEYKYAQWKLYEKFTDLDKSVTRKEKIPNTSVDLFSPEQQLTGYLRNLQARDLRQVAENMGNTDNSIKMTILFNEIRPWRNSLDQKTKQIILDGSINIHHSYNEFAKDSGGKIIRVDEAHAIPKLSPWMLHAKAKEFMALLDSYGCPKDLQATLFSRAVREGMLCSSFITWFLQKFPWLQLTAQHTVSSLINNYKDSLRWIENIKDLLPKLFTLCTSENWLFGKKLIITYDNLINYINDQKLFSTLNKHEQSILNNRKSLLRRIQSQTEINASRKTNQIALITQVDTYLSTEISHYRELTNAATEQKIEYINNMPFNNAIKNRLTWLSKHINQSNLKNWNKFFFLCELLYEKDATLLPTYINQIEKIFNSTVISESLQIKRLNDINNLLLFYEWYYKNNSLIHTSEFLEHIDKLQPIQINDFIKIQSALLHDGVDMPSIISIDLFMPSQVKQLTQNLSTDTYTVTKLQIESTPSFEITNLNSQLWRKHQDHPEFWRPFPGYAVTGTINWSPNQLVWIMCWDGGATWTRSPVNIAELPPVKYSWVFELDKVIPCDMNAIQLHQNINTSPTGDRNTSTINHLWEILPLGNWIEYVWHPHYSHRIPWKKYREHVDPSTWKHVPYIVTRVR